MRKILFSFFAVAFALFLLSHTERNKKYFPPDHTKRTKKHFPPEASGKWTGYLTLEEKTVWNEGCISMTSERHVRLQFTNALPTLYRDDGETDFSAYTDNKGTGSSEFHSEGSMCGQKGKTDCSASGVSELHTVTIRPWDNTYDIEAIAPPCIGTNADGSQYGPDIVVITVSNERLTSMDHLSGTKTTTGQVPGTTATATRTVTWHLERVKEDIYLIVTPEDYDNWMPEPGKNENTPGKQMKLSLKLQKRNGQPPILKATSFELTLSNTSREPGITINYPVNPGTAKPDMRFQWQIRYDTSNEGQSLKIDCVNPCLTANAIIEAFDGGAYTTLTAVAIMQDDSRIIGNLKIPGGEQSILIPKRNQGSNIAAKWVADHGNPADNDDQDISSGNTYKGDGLSAYEEYRGVISENEFGTHPVKFGRLDPQKKDLGIKLDKTELPLFAQGIKWFEDGSTLNVIRFFENEIGGDRRLNKNASHAHIYDQYTVVLYKGLLAYLNIGAPLAIAFNVVTTNGFSKPDIPSNIRAVVVDIGNVNAEYNRLSNTMRPARLLFTSTEFLSNVVAHELGHAVKIPHHGQAPDETTPQLATAPDVSPYHTFRVFDRQGTEIIARPYPLEGSIGKSGDGTLQSGDITCFMAYNPYYNWSYTRGADFARIYNQVPLTAIGRTMCGSSTGTGFNHSIIFFGNASEGNCLSKIKLKP